ncbi:MAG: hypothetical protein CTY16_13765 [Methylobacter sp.]|uniref:DoxX-like family protein n=1 Tax=Methylovulum miyakonense TaxID=645578 RepID=UPI00036ECCE2|nr:DoxX-like family protein [Methylovulum miyakonense]PPD43238.1 MAG: hypothetical protein CTY16_13765 [Methylobacter sp.]
MAANTLVLQICRFSVAFVWFYQGLVPKILGPHRDELLMNGSLGMAEASAVNLAYVGGSLEILLGIGVLVFYQQRWPFLVTIAAMLGLWLCVAVYSPLFLLAAFNPTTVNLTVVALSVIALLARKPI